MASTAPIATVTGGTGYLALEIVQQLLAKGYNVRATVRSVKNAEKNAPLLKLADALPGSLELFEADLLDPNGFDAAVRGATFVFHVASPVVLEADDPQRDIVDPAVSGSRNVLAAVGRASPRPRRVVLTSSIVSVSGFATAPRASGQLFTEDDWNEESTLETGPYEVSKTLAERAAWEEAGRLNVDLVTVLSGLIVGPAISAAAASSSAWVSGVVGGGAPLAPVAVVDIRDVARAHIAGAENPAAKGRYLVTGEEAFDFNTLVAWLREDYPGHQFAEPAEPKPFPRIFDVSRARRDLGLPAAVNLRVTFADAARTALALGAATLKPKA